MSNPDPNRPPIGMATSVFGHRLALTPAKLETIADTGLGWIELAALQDQHLSIWDEERVAELEKYLIPSKLRVWSVHAPFCSIGMDDAESRADGVRWIVRSAVLAERFGATCVVVHPGRDVLCKDRRRELQWTADNLLRALDRMPTGISLAMETMGRESLGGPVEEMRFVLDQLPLDRAGVCVDTGHVNTWTDPAGYIAAMAGRIVTVHLQDNMGKNDDHLLAGSGVINWPKTMAAFRQAGYRGVLMSEGKDPDLDAAGNSREFVSRMRAYC